MKKALVLGLGLLLVFCLTACVYNPPEGWTRRHHTYDQVLAFAKSIDPGATVAEEYTDFVDEYDWEYRQWDAVIHGVNCHVASVSDWVWNEGVAAGEFAQTYYRIDTDYDSMVMQNILSEEYPDWSCDPGLRSRYHSNTNTIYVELTLSEYRMLTDAELEQVWQTACRINSEYEKLAISRKAGFCVPSPGVYWNSHGEQESFVKKDGHTLLTEFTEEGKNAFLLGYQEDWALLESGLPVYG